MSVKRALCCLAPPLSARLPHRDPVAALEMGSPRDPPRDPLRLRLCWSPHQGRSTTSSSASCTVFSVAYPVAPFAAEFAAIASGRACAHPRRGTLSATLLQSTCDRASGWSRCDVLRHLALPRLRAQLERARLDCMLSHQLQRQRLPPEAIAHAALSGAVRNCAHKERQPRLTRRCRLGGCLLLTPGHTEQELLAVLGANLKGPSWCIDILRMQRAHKAQVNQAHTGATHLVAAVERQDV
eukprot:CAMPEP_0181246782 /NCGR_PEP_ID=MMETSP1096-20121128/44209_1 /TAXON_ID=156174 ORGANISM="Chrysochromulina ericina, Strain CCMP281" /NCGR_SAMPLE_ID=MMETSP1096 /ASSEMBLY_ACC=CAM_ASM_000453 /LENGTH=239 /DNA_ID=CAMNT_0023343685 /DNA_START=447 /DNA_END=1164 /DNA_ORIENTATION=+